MGNPVISIWLPPSMMFMATTPWLDVPPVELPELDDEPPHPTTPVAITSIAAARSTLLRLRLVPVIGAITNPIRLSASIRPPVPPKPPWSPIVMIPAILTCRWMSSCPEPPPEIMPVTENVTDAPAATLIGVSKVKTVVLAMSGELTVAVPTWVPPIDAVTVIELKIFGLLTDTLTDWITCGFSLVDV